MPERKLKVGTRVRIHTDPLGRFSMTPFQELYVGKETVIISRDDSRPFPFYKLEIDQSSEIGGSSYINEWLDVIEEPAPIPSDKKVERFDLLIDEVPQQPRRFDGIRKRFSRRPSTERRVKEIETTDDHSRRQMTVVKVKSKSNERWSYWTYGVTAIFNTFLGTACLPFAPLHGAFNFAIAGIYWGFHFQSSWRMNK